MIVKILLALPVVVVVLAGVVATRPVEFRVVRSATISAPAPAGAGAVYTWAGNHEVGQGRSSPSNPTGTERAKRSQG